MANLMSEMKSKRNNLRRVEAGSKSPSGESDSAASKGDSFADRWRSLYGPEDGRETKSISMMQKKDAAVLFVIP